MEKTTCILSCTFHPPTRWWETPLKGSRVSGEEGREAARAYVGCPPSPDVATSDTRQKARLTAAHAATCPSGLRKISAVQLGRHETVALLQGGGGRSGLTESLPDRSEICVPVFYIAPCKRPQDTRTTNECSIKKKSPGYLLCTFENTVADGSPESKRCKLCQGHWQTRCKLIRAQTTVISVEWGLSDAGFFYRLLWSFCHKEETKTFWPNA